MLEHSIINRSTLYGDLLIRGQNPLHVLGQHGRENAAAIFDFFIECMPKYPINKQDANGNTPLLLAYMNGNGPLCRAIARAGACLGTVNRNGISIFNHPVATKQLLFRLLGGLDISFIHYAWNCHLPKCQIALRYAVTRTSMG